MDTPLLFRWAVANLALGNRDAQHLPQLQPAALVKAARAFGITLALARELVADVCDRLDAGRDDPLEFAARLASQRDVLTSVGLVVAEMTAETRRRLLG